MIRFLTTNLMSKNLNWEAFENKQKNCKRKDFLNFFSSISKVLKFGIREGKHLVSGQSRF